MVEYHINLSRLAKNYGEFASFGEVFFPVKTNHNQIILNKLKKLGSGFECDCVDHIKKIYSKKNAHKIIFSNVAKPKNEILWALKHKIIFYTVDDIPSLRFIIQNAKKYKLKHLKINLRLNIYDVFKKVFIKKGVQDSRLGASVNKIKQMSRLIDKEKGILIEKGISFYVQAEVHDNKDMLIDMTKYISSHFSKENGFDWVNIGGGSSVDRLNYSKAKVLFNLKKIDAQKIILEPGRYMVGDVVDLYLDALRIKNENEKEVVVSLSAGIYHGLLDVKLHNRKFDIYIKNVWSEESLSLYKSGKMLVLRGPTADSSDIIGIYNIPKVKIDTNPVFIIKNAGAYVEALRSDFSGRVPIKYKVKN